MSYEFQSCLYATRADLCAAIAGEWLSAGGANTREFIEQTIADTPVEALVRECVDGWGLDDDWLTDRGIDLMYLYTGFRTVMDDPASAFGWNDDE